MFAVSSLHPFVTITVEILSNLFNKIAGASSLTFEMSNLDLILSIASSFNDFAERLVLLLGTAQISFTFGSTVGNVGETFISAKFLFDLLSWSQLYPPVLVFSPKGWEKSIFCLSPSNKELSSRLHSCTIRSIVSINYPRGAFDLNVWEALMSLFFPLIP